MGEWSKKIGEQGEAIVNELLNLFDWKNKPIGESITCVYPEKHKSTSAKKGKSTHGQDSFFIYKSPFFTGQLDHVVISSKFTDQPYPASTNYTFKSHFKDLAYTIECYERSNLKSDNSSDFRDIEHSKTIGVLFWLSNDSSSLKTSILEDTNAYFEDDVLYDEIYIIDNNRASFLYESQTVIDRDFPKHEKNFFYIDTGNNPSAKDKKYQGKELPVQLLVSDVQVYRLQNEQKVALAMVLKENFSIDSLKRMLGLAHNISKNLTSNFFIYYPDYDELHHANTVARAKQGFGASNFISNIQIRAYDKGFQSLGNTKVTPSALSQNVTNEPTLHHDQILPCGNELRDLLSRSIITDAEMNKLLKKKGVYLSKPSKENLIPILSSILLSPKEFDFLKEKQKSNDDKEKHRSDSIECKTIIKNKTLITALPSSLNLNKIAKPAHSNYDFHNANINISMIHNNPNKVKFEYQVTKFENNKIWFENKNEFNGILIFERKNDDLEIKSSSYHTAKETQLINDLIKKYIINDLKSNNFIEMNKKEDKILMKNLSNEQIIKLFLSLTSGASIEGLEFEKSISIDIEIDEETSLPNDEKIKWMENKVNKLKFDGSKIETIDLLTDSKYHQYLKCWGMITKYKLDSLHGQGTSEVKFAFNKSNNHEFEVNIEKTRLTSTGSTIKAAEHYILEQLDVLKLKNYKKIIASNKTV